MLWASLIVSELARGRLSSAVGGWAVLKVPALPAPDPKLPLVLLGEAPASLLAALNASLLVCC